MSTSSFCFSDLYIVGPWGGLIPFSPLLPTLVCKTCLSVLAGVTLSLWNLKLQPLPLVAHYHDDSHVGSCSPTPNSRPPIPQPLWRFPSNRPSVGAPAGREGAGPAGGANFSSRPRPLGALSPTAPAALCRGPSATLPIVGVPAHPHLAFQVPPDGDSSPSRYLSGDLIGSPLHFLPSPGGGLGL